MDNMHNKKTMSQAQRNEKYKKRYSIQRIVLDLKPDDYELIVNFAEISKITKKDFIVKSCKYIIDNNIQLK